MLLGGGGVVLSICGSYGMVVNDDNATFRDILAARLA